MPVPPGRHTDWPWIVSWVPRSWTAFNGKPPKKLLGNAKSTKPIPDPGEWLISWPLYFAFHAKGGLYFRIGLRYDDVDNYYQPSIALKYYRQ